MADSLKFILKNGEEVTSDFLPPYSVDEQIAFEEQFKCSFVAVEQAGQAMAMAAKAAEDGVGDGQIDPVSAYRVTWILWFGWRRNRTKLASKFSLFREILADWEFHEPEAEPEDPETPAAEGTEGEAGSLDPTAGDPPAIS